MQAKPGDTVKVHYIGRLADGTIFDSSKDRGALELELGKGEYWDGFETAVLGMAPGETKRCEVPCELAFGPSRDDMILEIPKEQIPDDVSLKIGDRFSLTQGEDEIHVVVRELKDTTVMLDANHPLAGHDVFFDIELLEILTQPSSE